MSQLTTVFFFPSREVRNVLDNYQTNIVELLQRAGIDARLSYAPDPAASLDAQNREPISAILLGSAAVIASLTPIINKIISELARKKVFVTETVCIPVENSSGEEIHDKSGEPILQWVQQSKFIESSQIRNESFKISVRAHGITASLEQASPTENNLETKQTD